LFLLAGAVYLLAFLLAKATGFGPLQLFARLALGCWILIGAAWWARFVWRRMFWSVGRRLAFSYVLVGVLPLALIGLLGLLAGYLLGGFLLGHLYRDAIDDLRDEMETAAGSRLHELAPGPDLEVAAGVLRFASYRRGRRVEGGPSAPADWPDWLARAQATRDDPAGEERHRPFVALGDGALSVAAVAGDAERGVVVWFEGDLAAWLRERTRTWVQLFRSDDPRKLPVTRIQVGGRVLHLRGLWLRRSPGETAEYYRLRPPQVPDDPDLVEKPIVLWMERAGTLRALASGEGAAEGVAVSLAASPRGLFQALLSTSEQADTTAWLALAGVAVLLFEIWAVAAAVAVFMIFGLSRAANRLTAATAAIGGGDFSVRIPGRRRDQLGDLQRSFNDMAAHLGELVETAAQKEALDKELALARSVQQDLLPDVILERAGIDIATYFEPSSAIGGDYYDVLERPDGRLAVAIADVAGHGLAAGLRMAMVKAGLTLLVAEGRPAGEVLSRLNRLLRRRSGERGFVTMTLADLDPASGDLELVNAGHTPCYVVRATGEVEEIALPGAPLGGLPGSPGVTVLRLAPGEGVVFLSDGIVEGRDAADELFGYERVRTCLAGPLAPAAELLERLLAGLRAHCGAAAPIDDDRTAVVLVYGAGAADADSPSRA
ncbi:MAG: SpoIIE family protein phosphatase, partial [Thermoanaerobaculia bacterium]